MKILKSDFGHGAVKIAVENLDDLWYLSHVVCPGDIVKSLTTRRIKGKEDTRAGRDVRKTITLAVRVERCEFRSDSDVFRILGTIAEETEDVPLGEHHTFNVGKESVLTIIKDSWSKTEIKQLKDAEKFSLRPKLLIAVIDDGNANIGLVRESKTDYFEVSRNIGGKYDATGRQLRKDEFYHEAAKFIDELMKRENVQSVILAGAGFEKSNFHRFVSDKYPLLAKNSMVENIGSHGRNGIMEVMKRDESKIAGQLGAIRDERLIEKLLEEIGKDTGLGAYGPGEVEKAVNTGAVETLLVTDNYFLEKRARMEPVMQAVTDTRGLVHIINKDSEAGQKLNALGGLAGILRFKVK